MARIENLIRIANADIDGSKQAVVALTNISGVSRMFSNALLNTLDIPITIPAQELKEEQVKRIEEAIKDPVKAGIPVWMLNRRNDPNTGNDGHLSGPDVKFIRDEDIKILKKIKSYKGLRHQWGLPVRGQRTKSNFRKNKGKVAGVSKKKEVKK
tara:strand:+ start:127 stop:588 length:462 start_codon:yes stop_codon:yes gene_type:complete